MDNNILAIRHSAKLMNNISNPYAHISEYVDAFTEIVKYPIRVIVTKFSRIPSLENEVNRHHIGALLTFRRKGTADDVESAEVVLDSEKPHNIQIYSLLLSFGRLLTDTTTPAPEEKTQYYPVYLEYSVDFNCHDAKSTEKDSIIFALLSIISDNEILSALMQYSNIYKIAEQFKLPPAAIKTRVLFGVCSEQDEECVDEL